MYNQSNTTTLANANLFVQALKTDFQLKNTWQALIARINQLPKNDKMYQASIDRLDNFLADSGFECNAKTVLNLLKTPFYQQHQTANAANADSDRFIKTILSDVHLFKAWQQVISKITTQSSQPADDFLKNKGFNCTATQVDASYNKLKHHNLAYWTGVYLTTLTDSSGKTHPGPTIIIAPNAQVSINQDILNKRLNKLIFNNGKLTWQTDDIGVKNSANFNLGAIIIQTKQSNYTGNYLSGTINYGNNPMSDYQGKYKILGRIGTLSESDDQAFAKVPADVSLPKMNDIIKYLGYVAAGLFFVKMLYTGGKALTTKFSEIKGKLSKRLKGESETTEMSESLEESPLANDNALTKDSDLLSDIQMKMDTSFSTIESNELKSDFDNQLNEETEFDSSINNEAEGEGWLENLSTIIR